MTAWDAAAVSHFYRRAAFGAPLETLSWARSAGRMAALESVFALRETDAFLEKGIKSLLGLDEIEHLQSWWLAHMMSAKAPLVERVALMWHDHFATSNDKVDDVRLMHAHIELLRTKGLGDFRELLHALTIDPAMLVWLDGIRNERGSPNENFAREVMELFGLGIGNYTEQDIGRAARALTGWKVTGRKAVFDAKRHEAGEWTIFGRGGVRSASDVVDRVLDHPACPAHITRRLLQEFVTPKPTQEKIEHWSKVLLEVDWNIERFLEQLLLSDDFIQPEARRSRIAGPVELAIGTMLSLEAEPPPRSVNSACSKMGQSLFRPPSVKGWDGGRSWIHAGHWLARHEVLTRFAFDDGVDLVQACGSPTEAAHVPSACLNLLLSQVDCPELQVALNEAASESESVETAVRECVARILTSPHYHLV
ncbi:MAG: hypothetical protein ACI841_001203 [Planctomycetota bacterium]|jgi:uncharacterized protein (DUF1800 family)